MAVQSDIYTRLLGSVQVATGSPVGQALENYNTTTLDDGALCFVRTGPGAGEWQLERASAAVADGTTVVAPLVGGPGRWIKRWAPGVPAPGGAAFYQTIQNNAGVAQVQQPIFQFTGSGVSVANDGPGTRTVVTINGGGAAFYQTVEDPLGAVLPQEPIIQFVGAGVSVVDDGPGTRTVVTITGSGPAFYQTVEDPLGAPLPQEPIIQFVGAGVSVTDDGPGTRTVVTIPGGTADFYQTIQNTAGAALPQQPIFQFAGDGLTVSDDPGGTRTIITVGGVTPAPTALYVNSTTGSDANPGTIGAPVATLTEALRRVGPVVRVYCAVIFTGAGVYDGTSLAIARDYLDYLDIYADEATEIVAATGTVGSSTFQEITEAGAPGWTVDQWLGHWVRMTSGAQSGQLRGILSNTAGAITVLDGYAANVTPGDTFEIVRPGVSIATTKITGDDDLNLGVSYVHLQYTGRLALQGTLFAVGVSFPTGSSLSSNQVYCASGGISSDFGLIGVSWLKVGASQIGSFKLLGGNGLFLFGHLGFVEASNVGGYGHSGGYMFGGRYALDATGSDLVIGNPFVSHQGTLALTYLDDYSVVDRPVWLLMTRGTVMRVSVGGSGPLAGRIMLRDKSFIEQSVAFETPAMPDLSGMSSWRIGYAGNGNFSNALVDNVNNNAGPGITFNTTNEVLTGDFGSNIFRTN